MGNKVRKATGEVGNLFDVVGLTGVVRFGGRVYEEWHPRLQGILGVRTYREMRDNDACIGAAVNLTQSVLRQVRWKAEPANGTPEAAREAQFLDECMADMNHTWADFMSEVVSYLWFGWALFEKTFKRRVAGQSRHTEGRIGLEEVAIRAQETLDEWEFDDRGGVVGMWQLAYPRLQRVFIPMRKSALFRTESNKDNPEGRSLLRNCYRSWFILKRLQELEAIGIERDAVGLPVVDLPWEYLQANASTDKRQAAQNFARLLQQIRRNEHEGVLFPSELDREGKPTGFRLRLLQGGGARQLSVTEPIQRYQREIAMIFNTQFQFLGQPGSAGSWSLSSDQTDLYAMSLGAILENIEETFHLHVTQELFALNGVPPELRPRWKHGDVEKPDVVRFADMLAKLIDVGVVTPDPALETHVREEVGLPPREGAEEEPTAEELAAAAEESRAAAGPVQTAGPVLGPPIVGPEQTTPVMKQKKLRGKTQFRGLPISLELLAGDVRSGTSREGVKWTRTMTHPYGYIPRTIGEDGEPTDVYLGPQEDAPFVFVVHQHVPNGDSWEYDEDKFMLGFSSEDEARSAYLAHYTSPKFCGGITRMPVEQFVRQRQARVPVMKGAAEALRAVLPDLGGVDRVRAETLLVALDAVPDAEDPCRHG